MIYKPYRAHSSRTPIEAGEVVEVNWLEDEKGTDTMKRNSKTAGAHGPKWDFRRIREVLGT